MKRCPNCREEITELQYREDATIYGTFDIETEDFNQDDTESDGNTKFICPECNAEFDSVNELIEEEEEEEEEERERRERPRRLLRNEERERTNNTIEEGIDLPIPPAIDENWRGEYSGFHNSHDRPKNSTILICPKCNCKNEAIEQETVECYNCNKEVNHSNAKKIIEIEQLNNEISLI